MNKPCVRHPKIHKSTSRPSFGMFSIPFQFENQTKQIAPSDLSENQQNSLNLIKTTVMYQVVGKAKSFIIVFHKEFPARKVLQKLRAAIEPNKMHAKRISLRLKLEKRSICRSKSPQLMFKSNKIIQLMKSN